MTVTTVESTTRGPLPDTVSPHMTVMARKF